LEFSSICAAAAATLAAGVLAVAAHGETPEQASYGPSPPAIAFVGRPVSNLDRSLAFYSKTFGMTEAHRYHHPGLVEVVMTMTGEKKTFLALIYIEDSSKRPAVVPGSSWIGIQVKDINATVAAAAANGAKVIHPAGGNPLVPVLTAHITDPDGYPIEILQPVAAQ